MSALGKGKLSVGLNLRPKKVSRAFTEDDAAPDVVVPPGSVVTTAAAAIKSKSVAKSAAVDHSVSAASASVPRTNASLLTLPNSHSLAAKRAEAIHQEALQQDAHVFDYDGVYDAMKARESQAKSAKQSQKGPRYMEALLRSAEIRKLDHLKAQTTKYKLEAAADKAEFGDTEAFVTSAYKESLEQIKRLEEEQERKAAEDAARAAKLGGMSAFYRNFLDRSEDSRGALKPLELATSASQDVTVTDSQGEPAVDDAEAAAAGVRVNDSGEIVDKRSLLVAGALNIRKRPDLPKPLSSSHIPLEHAGASPTSSRPSRSSGLAAHDSARNRAVLDVEVQKRKAEEEAEAERERLKAKLAKKADDATVSDARARYLARKAAKAAAESQQTAAPHGS